MFQLDGVKRQHPEPSQDVIAQLGLRHQLLLREYIAGKDPKTFSGFLFKPPAMESGRERNWRAAQKAILEQTGINIKKAWKEYQWHYPDSLGAQLHYPDDYLPDSNDVPIHFCAENWSTLQDHLRLEYAA